VAAGTHGISETQLEGYELTDVQGDCAFAKNGTIVVTVEDGDDAVCTLVNDDEPSSVSLHPFCVIVAEERGLIETGIRIVRTDANPWSVVVIITAADGALFGIKVPAGGTVVEDLPPGTYDVTVDGSSVVRTVTIDDCTPPPMPEPPAEEPPVKEPPKKELPFTGFDREGILRIASALLAAGILLITASRLRSLSRIISNNISEAPTLRSAPALPLSGCAPNPGLCPSRTLDGCLCTGRS
jgi:hypothetical protein